MTSLFLASWSIFLCVLVADGSLEQVCQPGVAGCIPEESDSLMSVRNVKSAEEILAAAKSAHGMKGQQHEILGLLQLTGGKASTAAARAGKIFDTFSASAEVTPEVKRVVGELIESIESDIMSEIIEDFNASQAAYNDAVERYDVATTNASTSYQTAITKDEEYVACIEIEKALAQNYSVCDATLANMASVRNLNCSSSNSSSTATYRLIMQPFTCDFKNDDDCSTQWGSWSALARNELRTIQGYVSSDNDIFEAHFSNCAKAAQDERDQDQKCKDTDLKWARRMANCEGKNTDRKVAICNFDNRWNARCNAHDDKVLLHTAISTADATSGGYNKSETDRQEEWRALYTLKCMLKKYKDDVSDFVQSSLTDCQGENDGYATDVGTFDYQNTRVSNLDAHTDFASQNCWSADPTETWAFSTEGWTIDPSDVASRTVDGTTYTFIPNVAYGSSFFSSTCE